MRTLSPRPHAVIDPRTRAPLAGSYRGGLPRVDPSLLGKSPLFRLAHEKRWVYMAVTAGDLLVAAVVTRFGYASNSFAFVYDRAEGRGSVYREAQDLSAVELHR